eukprot:TRINITY_DN2452_c0_g1_i6.p1 TRINITY_DN2452_c0_g1~~TRINITY_DN2452_c0_g1_i6.p1  ORF type:complete len:155 (+),score=54.00 TRINITY_DN2452_c0_g1_i6:39-467(+)
MVKPVTCLGKFIIGNVCEYAIRPGQVRQITVLTAEEYEKMEQAKAQAEQQLQAERAESQVRIKALEEKLVKAQDDAHAARRCGRDRWAWDDRNVECSVCKRNCCNDCDALHVWACDQTFRGRSWGNCNKCGHSWDAHSFYTR